MDGFREPSFEPLEKALDASIKRMGGGAALSVFVDGTPVFDMWGGERNADGDPWQRETTSVSYSTTKGVISTALHMLADRGQVDYDAPVARYWPEFAQNGKSQITVADVMSHRAGLHDVRNLVVHADTLLDWDATVDTLARAPAAPATLGRHAYHAVTYGHLVGEIVRRVSGTPVPEFVRSEIAEPLGLEGFWIGAPPEAIAHAARLMWPQRRKPRTEHGKGKRRRKVRTPGGQLVRGAMRLAGLPIDAMRMRDAFSPRGIDRWDPSSPRVLAACVPSFNGLFTARDLGRMYACLARGGELDGVRLLSEATLARATRVHGYRPDSILVVPLAWRLGYHSVVTTAGMPRRAYGHFGLGGSGAWADPQRRMSLAFTVNVGSGTPVGDWRLFKLSGLALRLVDARARRGV